MVTLSHNLQEETPRGGDRVIHPDESAKFIVSSVSKCYTGNMLEVLVVALLHGKVFSILTDDVSLYIKYIIVFMLSNYLLDLIGGSLKNDFVAQHQDNRVEICTEWRGLTGILAASYLFFSDRTVKRFPLYVC